jgi:hypothetical protein
MKRRDVLLGAVGTGLAAVSGVRAAPRGKMPLLGVNLGNVHLSDIERYEAWLGRRVDFVQVFTGRAGWKDYLESVNYGGGLFRDTRPIHWSVPLFAEGATLADAAGGAYDKYWKRVAHDVLACSPGTGSIYFRTGWEFNYRGQPWFSGGQEALFVESFRRFVGILRGASDRFRFIWCPNYHVKGQNPELSYPGDDVVDVISMDFYVYRGFKMTGEEAWKFYRYAGGGYGLEWLVKFARAHSKPVAVDEWGVMFDRYQAYIEAAADFFRENNFLYTAYWESKSSYYGMLSDGHLPDTAEQFRKSFGKT